MSGLRISSSSYLASNQIFRRADSAAMASAVTAVDAVISGVGVVASGEHATRVNAAIDERRIERMTIEKSSADKSGPSVSRFPINLNPLTPIGRKGFRFGYFETGR